jgi:surfeit locus 1 family protein
VSERTKFWLLTTLALLAVSVTLSLGCWQLSRAVQKAALQARTEAQAALPLADGAVLNAGTPPSELLQRRIAVRGRWLAEQTVFLDNRQMQGKVGFFVVTPLQLESSPRVLLVQRGWAPRNFQDRRQVPRVVTPTGSVEVLGRIVPLPAKLYELGQSEAGPIRQNLDLAEFSGQTGLPLLEVSLQQEGVASEGLLRDWPQAGSGIEKHHGYAFQWFGLSALIALLYVWFQIVRRFIPRRSH